MLHNVGRPTTSTEIGPATTGPFLLPPLRPLRGNLPSKRGEDMRAALRLVAR